MSTDNLLDELCIGEGMTEEEVSWFAVEFIVEQSLARKFLNYVKTQLDEETEKDETHNSY